MSRGRATSPDKVELTVLTSSGKKHELQVSLNDTLFTLKEQIHECTSIPIEQQRTFFMGREMKTNGRSLQSLGVGRFGIMVIHVLNTGQAPKKKKNQNSNTFHKESRVRKRSRCITFVNRNPPEQYPPEQQQQQEVVELLDDSDEEDDAKVVACVIDMTEESSPTASSRREGSSKRRRVS